MANMKQNVQFQRIKILPNHDISGPSSRQVVDPNDTMDLVTYIGTLLPESVNPNHVLLGIGLACAGVAGACYILRRMYREYSQVNELSDAEAFSRKLAQFPRFENGVRPEGVLIRNQCPRGRKTPCIAAYPLKLEMFLRVAGIKYWIDSDLDKNGNIIPTESLLILDMENLPESQVCMKNLSEKFGVDLSQHLSPELKGIELAFSHLLEQKIYWALSLYRWVYDGARTIERIQCLPEITRESITSVARTVEHAAWHHGVGQRTPTEVIDEALQDLAALSIQLGANKYLMGNLPTELDTTAFAMLCQILWTMDGPLHEAVSVTYTNLSQYCWRLRNEFWPDWDQCLSN